MNKNEFPRLTSSGNALRHSVNYEHDASVIGLRIIYIHIFIRNKKATA